MKIYAIFALLTVCYCYDMVLDKKKLCEQSGVVDKEDISVSEDIQFGSKTVPKSLKFKIFEDLCKDEPKMDEDYKIEEDEELTFSFSGESSEADSTTTSFPLLKPTTSATMRNYLVTPKIAEKTEDKKDILSNYAVEEWLGSSAKNVDLNSNRKQFEKEIEEQMGEESILSSKLEQKYQSRQPQPNMSVDCPKDWYDGMGNGWCLRYQLQAVPYYVAQVNCQIMGGRLFEPIDVFFQEAASFYFMTFVEKRIPYWIGVKYDKESKEYVYDSSGRAVNESHWHEGHPVGPHGCVASVWNDPGMNPNEVYAHWKDDNCGVNKAYLCELDRITEEFWKYMKRSMVQHEHWSRLFSACLELIEFVQKHNKDWKNLVNFNIECLIHSPEYSRVYQNLLIGTSASAPEEFKNYMRVNMKDDHWRLLLHWILEWQMSLVYLNPPVPQPWPQPLFDDPLFEPDPYDRYNAEEMILHFLENKEVIIPPTASPTNQCIN